MKNQCNLSDFLLELVFSNYQLTQSIKEELVGLTIKYFDENRILYEYLDSIDIMQDAKAISLRDDLHKLSKELDPESIKKAVVNEKN